MSDEYRDATAEEVELLHTAGFFEVGGWRSRGVLEGVWQRGRAGMDLPKDAEAYNIKEALELVRKEQRAKEA